MKLENEDERTVEHHMNPCPVCGDFIRYSLEDDFVKCLRCHKTLVIRKGKENPNDTVSYSSPIQSSPTVIISKWSKGVE